MREHTAGLACYVTEPRWSPPQRLFDLDTHHSLQVIPFETRLYAPSYCVFANIRLSFIVIRMVNWYTVIVTHVDVNVLVVVRLPEPYLMKQDY